MWCSDPLLDYLKSFGYCVVLLPKADLRPLQILSKQGSRVSRLGELTTVLLEGSTIPLPSISENNKVANISGQRTSDLKIGIGLTILDSVLLAMGGSVTG